MDLVLNILTSVVSFIGVFSLLAIFVGTIWGLVIAFKESPLHGLLSFFLYPLYSIYYFATRWHKCKKPAILFIGGLIGIIVSISSFIISGLLAPAFT